MVKQYETCVVDQMKSLFGAVKLSDILSALWANNAGQSPKKSLLR